MIRLSREEKVPEFRELDMRIMRQAASYILEAMRGNTLTSLTLHVQQLVLHCLEVYQDLNLKALQGSVTTTFHLPGCVRQLNTVGRYFGHFSALLADPLS